MAAARPELRRETPKKRAVPDAPSFEPKGPGVRRLVAERVLPIAERQVRRDRDPVRLSVADLSSRELARGEPHARGLEGKARGEAVVEKLEPGLVVLRLDREEGAHRIRLASASAKGYGGKEKRMGRRVASLAVAFAAVGALARAQSAGKMITYSSGPETVSGYLAAPEGAGRKPAVVVIHEWWGLNDFAKGKADSFAKQGYVTLAVDLYRGKVTADADVAHQLMRGLPDDRALRDLQAAVTYLRSRPDVDTKRIGSVGWCMGGGWSLNLALAEPTLAGAVIYYGHLMTEDATIQKLKVALIGSFGGKDQGIPAESVSAFQAKARALQKNVFFKIYPEAGHAFASSTDPKVFRPDDAKDADARTDSFFRKVLKGE
jgi:carboxymethylenebutenolidase